MGKLWGISVAQIVMGASTGGYFAAVATQNNSIAEIIGIIGGGIFGLMIERNSWRMEISNKWWEKVMALIPMGIMIGSMAIVLSPLVITQKVDGTTFLRFPNVTDYYKHIYTIQAIARTGIPPLHPYFPLVPMSYYWGYYLLPGIIVKIAHINAATVAYGYVLVTSVIGLRLIYEAGILITKKTFWAAIGMIVVMMGTGLDIIPTLKSDYPGKPFHHIELWSQGVKIAYHDIHTQFLWAPQHFLAASIVVWLIVALVEKYPLSKKTLVLSTWYIFTLSSFVSISWLIFWGIYFWVSRERQKIIVSMLVSGIMLLPLFSGWMGHEDLIEIYKMQPQEWAELFVEYGIVYILAVPLLLKFKMKIWGIWIGVLLITTWLIKSSGFNDFDNRVILPGEILAAITVVWLIFKISNQKVKWVVAMLFVINLGVGGAGMGYEYYYRWKERKILDPYTSQMLININKDNDQRLIGTLIKDESFFQIPIWGGKMILSPSMYDAWPYLAEKDKYLVNKYETEANKLFTRKLIAVGIRELVKQKENDFGLITKFLMDYPTDDILINKTEFVKKGLNPWGKIFSEMSPVYRELAGKFMIFDKNKLIADMGKNKLGINSDIKEYIADDGWYELKKGTYFLMVCNDEKERKVLKFEPEDYYLVMEVSLKPNECGGQLFVKADDEKMKMTRESAKRFWVGEIII